LLFVFGALYYSAFLDYGINLLDEGYLLNSSLRVLNGEVPYRDFYTPYPPGRYYLVAAIFKIFGINGLFLRILEAIILLSTSIILFKASRLLGISRIYSLIPSFLIFIAPGPWHKCFYPFFTSLNILALIAYIKKQNYIRFTLVSSLIGLTILFRQDLAFISLIMILSHMLYKLTTKRGSRKTYILFSILIGSIIVAGLLPISPFYFMNAAPQMIDLLLNAGFNEVKATSLPFATVTNQNLFRNPQLVAISQLSLKLIFFIPFVVYLVTILLLIKDIKGFEDKIPFLTVVIFGLLANHQIIWRSDLSHLLQSSAPVYLLIGFLLDSITIDLEYSDLKKFTKFTCYFLIFSLFTIYSITIFIAGGKSYPGNLLARFGDKKILASYRASFYVDKNLGNAIEKCINRINSNTDNIHSIVALPDIPLFYFLADRKNPTYHDLYIPGRLKGEAEQIQIIENFKKNPPKLIIFNSNQTDDGLQERKFETQQYILSKFINQNYKNIDRIGSFIIYELDLRP